MTRAPSVCCEPACPNLAVRRGRCAQHATQPFDTSTYRTRRTIPDKLRQRILTRDHHTCQSCWQPGNIVDHIVPRALGGTDHDVNLQVLCEQCSRTKTAVEANQIRNGRYRPQAAMIQR